MADLNRAVKTPKKVQNNIEMFESLSLNESRSRSNTISNRPAIIEVDSAHDSTPLITAVSTRSTIDDNRKPGNPQLAAAKNSHRKRDSTAFLQKSYLHKKDDSLLDLAREILKDQPSLEEVAAVLSYFQYGIDGQMDFNIKITSPRASLFVHILVSITIPDLWPNLGLTEISEPDLSAKNLLLSVLLSVTGIELILNHIEQYSRTLTGVMVKVYLDFLATLLDPSDTILRLLRDSKQLYKEDAHRRLFWQSIMTLVAGGKILSKIASVPTDQVSPSSWLSNGTSYSHWLARNIVRASTEVAVVDTDAWNHLCKLLSRGMSLGYKGKVHREVCEAYI